VRRGIVGVESDEMCEILHTLNASFLECGEHAVGTEMASGGRSAGGDGGRKAPELPRNPHTSLFAAASDCRAIAIYEYAAYHTTRRHRLSSITRAPCRSIAARDFSWASNSAWITGPR